ncbi:protein SSUH2 homolog isoform X2 [Sceloporus undulatus]|uniref:protein SSUH2 homolog isoform X2 n=1 Tax=Sceloporus undulatus TaxID=8520 RepID=UPI001C4DC521|nr:protein SSUH2 homolog isoform X2 [Sceloporus undulatus]
MAEGWQAFGGSAYQNFRTTDQMPAQGTFGAMPQTPGPPAPFLADMGSVSGYEGTTAGDSGGKHFPPPPDLVPVPGNQPYPPQINWNIPAISEDEAKEAFVGYAASKCCYSQAPAKEMCFQDLQAFNTYRYRLETFTESRSSVWKAEPYDGGPVDSFLCGIAPLPWDVRVQIPAMFKDRIERIKVPHTSSVKQQCWVCSGKGNRLSNDICTSCMGTGTTMCNDCSGVGTITCSDCKGRGQVLVYIELQVEWKNNIFEYVADQRIGFPTELFKEVNGKNLLCDEQLMVYPVWGFPDNAISHASKNAVEQHRAQFGSTSQILRQRQTIELIFLTRVEYAWRGKSHSYYVYGNEHKVYAEDYPAKCCCTII